MAEFFCSSEFPKDYLTHSFSDVSDPGCSNHLPFWVVMNGRYPPIKVMGPLEFPKEAIGPGGNRIDLDGGDYPSRVLLEFSGPGSFID